MGTGTNFVQIVAAEMRTTGYEGGMTKEEWAELEKLVGCLAKANQIKRLHLRKRKLRKQAEDEIEITRLRARVMELGLSLNVCDDLRREGAE